MHDYQSGNPTVMWNTLRSLAALLVCAVLAACSAERPTVTTHSADAYPDRLSAWGLMRVDDGELLLGAGVEPYDLNTALFTDYAQKLRTVWMPEGSAARYHNDETFEFPVGTVISKTFFYPERGGVMQTSFSWPASADTLDTRSLRLMETRLLVKQESGWDALPYVWRGNDAYLKIAGDLQMIDIALADGMKNFPYIVPSRNQCASCHATNHTTGALLPIGPKARHLNRPYLNRGENQLQQWQASDRLTDLPELHNVALNAALSDSSAGLDDRARAYLDINCGHCHNAQGAADTSGLLLDASVQSSRQLGLCKPPIAAGGGTGGRPYSIVPGQPEHSILVYRMQTTDPAAMMPELGRSLAHSEGITLLTNWIASLDGECVEMSSD
jgi:uncharacterized repeat protein (TIGR03806 family)